MYLLYKFVYKNNPSSPFESHFYINFKHKKLSNFFLQLEHYYIKQI